MPAAHPTSTMLRDYANGHASTGVSLLVAAHVTYCPACRKAVEGFEAVAAAILRLEDEQTVNHAALTAAMARLDEPAAPVSAQASRTDAILPAPVAAFAGASRDMRWRFVMPGVSRVELGGEDGEEITLLRVRPGSGVPSHTHTGVEATLVLSGALRDRGAVYGVGDVAVATSVDDHHPRAEPGADCICLAVVTGGVRFTGPLSRALNIFAE